MNHPKNKPASYSIQNENPAKMNLHFFTEYSGINRFPCPYRNVTLSSDYLCMLTLESNGYPNGLST